MFVKGVPRPKRALAGSANAMSMLHDDRVLFVYPEGIIYRPVPVAKPARQVPLTLVIPVHEPSYLDEALRSLIMQKYDNWQIMIVCADPAAQWAIFEAATLYQADLPKISIFVMKERGWLSDSLNAALHNVTTAYWCRLDPDDLLHPTALQVVSARIQEHSPDYLYSARFVMNSALHVSPAVLGHTVVSQQAIWSGNKFPFSHLITYKTAAVARIGGFKSYDQFPNDAEWIAAYEMLAKGFKFHYINGALYYWRSWKGSARKKEPTAASDYRRGLILQHWPDRYVEDYSSR